jgi:hypothetical protein
VHVFEYEEGYEERFGKVESKIEIASDIYLFSNR